MEPFPNPFRPGAGQPPPYLAGREHERIEFKNLLNQQPILKNVLITGLRGVGKTVLLESLKPIASENGWFWAGNDLSESSSISEESLALRIITDISTLVSSFTIGEKEIKKIGFNAPIEKVDLKLNFATLTQIYQSTPGLVTDKLKNLLDVVWQIVSINTKVKGIVLAYDEAQILKDKAQEKQYPLSLLLEVIQYLQRREIPYLLVLTGLPTLYPNLIEARTYAERMFTIITLEKLSDEESKKAIQNPIKKVKDCPVTFSEYGISEIIKYSNGYPYFIQFICKEFFDTYLQQIKLGIEHPVVTIVEFVKRLDTDFYAGRWGRVTERQKELLIIIAQLPNANDEFSNKEIVDNSIILNNEFKTAQVNNMLTALIDAGLVFKNRRSKYSFAIPLLADYIKRQGLEQ